MRWRALTVVVLTAVWAGSARGQSVALARSFVSSGYEKIKEEQGVKVFRHRTARIIDIGAEGTFPAPPEAVYRALLDYEGQRGYIARLSTSRVLDRGRHWLIVYQRLNLPVISDRDFTLYVRAGRKEQLWSIDFWVARGTGPAPQPGVERVSNHRGSWRLAPRDNGRATFARFQTAIDMGGLLPRWLARAGAGKELPALYQSFCRMICRRVPCSSKCLSQ